MPETATEYGKARGVGKGVRTCGVPREELFVVSKVAAEHKLMRKRIMKEN